MRSQHISVCVCTFKRPQLLAELLRRLEHQETEGQFTYSVVVADNDDRKTAEETVIGFSDHADLPVRYCVQPEQNIALARNTALDHATGDYIAFIDDDEFPDQDWLLSLFQACSKFGADGVLGPVKPHFEVDPPLWVKKGKFFDRPVFATGFRVPWPATRTGNVLFKRNILDGVDMPFSSQFDAAGEDVDFFRRMIQRGYSFVWCDEAVVYEHVPESRCRRRYLLRRALLRGSSFPKQSAHRVRNAIKSVIAVPCYTLALPVLALAGHHVFLKYLIKLFDHASRLCALLGLPLVTQRET